MPCKGRDSLYLERILESFLEERSFELDPGRRVGFT